MKAIVTTLIVSLTVGVSQAPVDFSGEWMVEAEAPAARGKPGAQQPARGDMGSGWGSPITIRQDAAQLIVEHQVFGRYDLQPPLRHIYALDGSETQYPIMISHTTQMRRSRATWNGSTLEITTTYPVVDPTTAKPFAVSTTQRLTLDSPTTLVVDVTRRAAFGGRDTTSRTVYRKQ